jgi:acyl carrier protein
MGAGVNLERLKGAFREALNVDPAANFEALAYGVTTGWDSVAHMSLVAAIESAFDIMLATDEVIDLSSFPKAREIVGRHGITLDA